jgi:hypothetical protein
MWHRDIINFKRSLILILLLLAFLANGVPKEIALSQTRAECSPKYEECISSCDKQNNSCYEGAGTDTHKVARCDDQYTACNEKCFRDFCPHEKGEKSNE